MSWMSEKEQRIGAIALLGFAAAAAIPLADDGYYLSLSVNIAMYTVLCTAWTLFSGPTHYISLATAAFFGVGTYSVGLGIDVLQRELLRIAGWHGAGEDVILARERHMIALRSAREHIVNATESSYALEIMAEELRLAQQAINEITGEFGSDDLLGVIFSRFCIGK